MPQPRARWTWVTPGRIPDRRGEETETPRKAGQRQTLGDHRRQTGKADEGGWKLQDRWPAAQESDSPVTDPSGPAGSSHLLVPPPSGWHLLACSARNPRPTCRWILMLLPMGGCLWWGHSLQMPGSYHTCHTALPAPREVATRTGNTKPDIGQMSGVQGRRHRLTGR